jgi:hypothetical protein
LDADDAFVRDVLAERWAVVELLNRTLGRASNADIDDVDDDSTVRVVWTEPPGIESHQARYSPAAALTIARMPARIASGSVGHR